MHIFECQAYTNPLRRLDPGYKVALALVVIGGCLLLNDPLTSMLAIVWMAGLTVRVAHIPVRRYLQLLAAESLFLAVSLLGVVFSMGVAPQPVPWVWQVGPLWLGASSATVWLAVGVLLRALGAASAMNLLATTTPMVDLMDFLRRFHTPEFLIDIMTVMYRFIFVLLDRLGRIYTAQECRLGYVNRRRAMQSASLLGSQLFVDSLRRTQRVQVALESRGYAGALRVLPPTYVIDRRWPWLILAVAASMVGVSLLW